MGNSDKSSDTCLLTKFGRWLKGWIVTGPTAGGSSSELPPHEAFILIQIQSREEKNESLSEASNTSLTFSVSPERFDVQASQCLARCPPSFLVRATAQRDYPDTPVSPLSKRMACRAAHATFVLLRTAAT